MNSEIESQFVEWDRAQRYKKEKKEEKKISTGDELNKWDSETKHEWDAFWERMNGMMKKRQENRVKYEEWIDYIWYDKTQAVDEDLCPLCAAMVEDRKGY